MFLWTGLKHSGKTTALRSLVVRARERGLAIAGLIAPAVREHRMLIGYDAEDAATGRRAPLLRLAAGDAAPDVGSFALQPAGVALGAAALGKDRTRNADLVVVDEFGPLEMAGGLWRPFVDALALADTTLVVAVRDDLAEAVRRIYKRAHAVIVPAAAHDAADRVFEAIPRPDR